MRLIFVILLFIVSLIKSNGQDIFDKESTLKFTKYLLKNNKYDLVMQEYERIKFLNWETDSLLYQLYLSHWLNNNSFQQIEIENKLVKKYPSSTFALWLNYTKSKPFLKDSIQTLDSTSQIIYLKSLLFNSNWDLAEDLLIGNTFISKTDKGKMIKIIENGLKVKKRSPFLGSVLSTIVPGLGKIYANEIKDGIFAFVFVASSSIGLWRVVENNGWNSPWTYFFGGITTGFYLGNIYGSFHSVKRFNVIQTKDLKNEKYQYLLY